MDTTFLSTIAVGMFCIMTMAWAVYKLHRVV
jgi:hypothetical protein